MGSPKVLQGITQRAGRDQYRGAAELARGVPYLIAAEHVEAVGARQVDAPIHSMTTAPAWTGDFLSSNTSGIIARNTIASVQNVSATASIAACFCTIP